MVHSLGPSASRRSDYSHRMCSTTFPFELPNVGITFARSALVKNTEPRYWLGIVGVHQLERRRRVEQIHTHLQISQMSRFPSSTSSNGSIKKSDVERAPNSASEYFFALFDMPSWEKNKPTKRVSFKYSDKFKQRIALTGSPIQT